MKCISHDRRAVRFPDWSAAFLYWTKEGWRKTTYISGKKKKKKRVEGHTQKSKKNSALWRPPYRKMKKK